MRIKIVLLVLTIVTSSVGKLGCDDNGNTQQIETELEFAFSGIFVPGPANTDTIDDGRPSSLRTYEGVSGFGYTNITILDEFA